MASSHTRSGRGRGRGAFRGRTSFPSVVPSLPAPSVTQEQLASVTISELAFTTPSQKLYKIRDVDFIASYNWVDSKMPTILVPGTPPKWLPPAEKQQLREDSGQYYRDPNAARSPRYPLEPALRSIYEVNSVIETSKIDIFCCGSTFGSLLSFARSEERTFRFGVERIGKTIFLVRKTNTAKELIQDVRGYGHSFPEAYTVWDAGVKGSSSHQRIISYNFGELKCLIRTECDGYLPGNPHKTDSAPKSVIKDSISHDGGVLLEGGIAGLDVLGRPSTQPGRLTVRKAGGVIDQQAIFDLKTRSIMRKDAISLSEFLPRLWANQTPNFVLGWHRMGRFDEIEVKDVRSDILKWEVENQKTLARLHAVLSKLIELSNKSDWSRFEVRRTDGGAMEIWSEVEGWSALPLELKNRWRDGADEGQNTEVGHKERVEDGDEAWLKF